MKPVRSIRNQYRGINAHLHSHFQAHGGWPGFHTLHIGHLAAAMQRQLRMMGYSARIEESLQIRTDNTTVRYPTSDVSIYDELPQRPSSPQWSQHTTDASELVLPLPAFLNIQPEELQFYRAIVIESKPPGDIPVAWVELLSPSNKPGSQHAQQYRDKRTRLLQAGIVFVELDYLHSSPPTFETLPVYRPQTPAPENGIRAHAYRIVVLDPRPAFLQGEGRTRQFDVDEVIPTMRIPLNAGDQLAFDFNAPYQQSYQAMFYGDNVDYAQLPAQFDHYRRDDQTRIVCRMVATLQAAQRGEDLETAIIDPPALELDDALHQLESLRPS